tara:strand:+ start:367 stop:699 length:333 start_codon:yes stop_codon:yes gene_type:complete
MRRFSIALSIGIFSFFLGLTSVIKNQTRITEKKIEKVTLKILNVKKDLHETELDYYYLSSPKNLSKKINELSLIEYTPIEFSKIYLDYKDFINSKNKLTNYKKINEKKTK